MREFLRLFRGVAIVWILSAIAIPAYATPFAGVQLATWSVRWNGFVDLNGDFAAFPETISISCFGTAVASGNNGCEDTGSLIVTGGSNSISRIGGISITNTGPDDILGYLRFVTAYSAFNPGGSPIGAQVDDPTLQFAAFSGSVTGRGTNDFHGCNTLTGPHFIGPNACGVSSPDSSQQEFFLGPIAAGATIDEQYAINIFAEVIAPEPITVSVFGTGCAGIVILKKRRRPLNRNAKTNRGTE